MTASSRWPLALLLALSLCAACSDGGSGPAKADKDTAGADADAAAGSDVFVNNWAQGYTFIADFHGGYADGKHVRVDRDLSKLAGGKTVFSFGSTHYSLGEIGLAMTETLYIEVGGNKKSIEINLNFGLVKGSSQNPVHVDKAAVYPFSCRAPDIRVFFMADSYRSVCAAGTGQIEVTAWSNEEGGTFAGTFSGRLMSFSKGGGQPDACVAAEEKAACKSPETWADVKGWFGFELPEKDG